MAVLNKIINAIFAAIFAPFNGLSPIIGLSVISVLFGVAMIYLFKLTSNQKAIAGLKDKIKGGFLEIKLYQNEPGIVGAAFGRILFSNLIYLRYTMVPLLYMAIPVMIILFQCEMRYEVRPLAKGEQAVVTVKVAKSQHDALNDIKLEVPQGVKIVVDAVRINEEGEADWKIRIDKEGSYNIKVKTGNEEITMSLKAQPDPGPVVKAATGGSAWQSFLNPGLPPINGNSPVKRIQIEYPNREIHLFGKTPHWLIIFFVVSMLFGFAVKGVFGVEI